MGVITDVVLDRLKQQTHVLNGLDEQLSGECMMEPVATRNRNIYGTFRLVACTPMTNIDWY